MMMNDLLRLLSEKKRKQDSIKEVKKIAIVIGVSTVLGIITGLLLARKSGKEVIEGIKEKAEDTAETIIYNVQKNVDTAKDYMAQAAFEVNNVIDDIQDKTNFIKKDIKDGYAKVTHDIQKSVDDISQEINK